MPYGNSNVVKSALLHSTDGGSDKLYNIYLVEVEGGFKVNFENGKRGGNLKAGTKHAQPVALADATSTFDRLTFEKINGSSHYQLVGSTVPQGAQLTPIARREESQYRAALPTPAGDTLDDIESMVRCKQYVFQEKHNGERVIIVADDTNITGVQKQGYTRTLPGHLMSALSGHRVVLDGELVDDDYFVFDILEHQGDDLRTGIPYETRLHKTFHAVAAIGHANVIAVDTAYTELEKRALLARLDAAKLEGVVIKKKHADYSDGGLKYKFGGESSVIVHEHSKDRRSVTTAAYHRGEYLVLGKVTIPGAGAMPPVGSIIEVKYIYAQAPSFALQQPSFAGVRTDQSPQDCQTSKFRMWRGEGVEDMAANPGVMPVPTAARSRPRP